MILDLFSGAWRNISRRKTRSFLTMLGISIGIASVLIVLAIGKGSENYIAQQLDNLGIGGLQVTANPEKVGSYELFGTDDLELISKNIPEIQAAMPMSYDYGYTTIRNDTVNAIIWGVGANVDQVVSINLKHGRGFHYGDIEAARPVCMINASVAQEIYGRENIVGKSININIKSGTMKLEIIGVTDSQSALFENLAGEYIPAFIYMPYTTVLQLKNITYLDQIALKVKDGADADQAGEKIVTLLENKHQTEGYYVESFAQQKDQLNNILNIVTLTISAIAGISLLVGGIGIMTLMMVSVNERKTEIGVKKSIGAKNRDILLEFLTEALLLTTLGGLTGILIGVSASIFLTSLFGLPFQLQRDAILLALAFSMLIGIVFSVYPAQKAARQDPVNSLRGN